MKGTIVLSAKKLYVYNGRVTNPLCFLIRSNKRFDIHVRKKLDLIRAEENTVGRYYTTSKKEEHNVMKKKSVFLTWRCLALNVALSGPILYFYMSQCEKRKGKGHVGITTVENIGKPLIGGDFTLFNHNGQVVTNKYFKNKFCLIYFGFTYCPDICPQELEKQTIVIEKIGKKYGDIITPVFISVDPNRDTLAQVKHYCSSFSDKLVGLTGTKEQIKNVAKLFRVYYNEHIANDQNTKTDDENTDSPLVNKNNYLIDHSIIHYLLDGDGKFVDFFGKNCTINEMVDKISHYIDLHLQNGLKMEGYSKGG
ncbi:Cg3 protein [Plasmodium gonderi]|uniref:Cg3 protein n=1 Tax=Plasmodium gonderi TaxID=77519 RepID=A0A1Y1JC32_PLAGO|nr:Cg3 protein [Plasmodium gonderi]GAW78925.1 Cg3 protein [Plasmodium gonderi]